MRVGELYWVVLPARGGHAQAGRRPAMIAQQVTNLSTVLIVPLTSQQDSLRFPATVFIEADNTNGLLLDSVALVFQLTAIDKRYLADRLGEIAPVVIDQIWQALDELTGRA